MRVSWKTARSSVQLCEHMVTAEQLDAAIRKNLEVLGYGEWRDENAG